MKTMTMPAPDRSYIGTVPPHVEEVALKLLQEAWEKARKMTAPGDGSLLFLGDAVVGEGMFTEGGYSLQAAYVCDERFEDRATPTLRVHVFSTSHWKADGFLSVPGPDTDPDVLVEMERTRQRVVEQALYEALDRTAPTFTADQLRRLFRRVAPLARKTLGRWMEPAGSFRDPYRVRKDIHGTEIVRVTGTTDNAGYLVYVSGTLMARWLDEGALPFTKVLAQVDELLLETGYQLGTEED